MLYLEQRQSPTYQKSKKQKNDELQPSAAVQRQGKRQRHTEKKNSLGRDVDDTVQMLQEEELEALQHEFLGVAVY